MLLSDLRHYLRAFVNVRSFAEHYGIFHDAVPIILAVRPVFFASTRRTSLVPVSHMRPVHSSQFISERRLTITR